VRVVLGIEVCCLEGFEVVASDGSGLEVVFTMIDGKLAKPGSDGLSVYDPEVDVNPTRVKRPDFESSRSTIFEESTVRRFCDSDQAERVAECQRGRTSMTSCLSVFPP
jgi:hypothetical protein